MYHLKTLGLTSIFLTAFIHGQCAKTLDTRVDLLETDVAKIRAETAYGTLGPRTASAQPQIDGFGFFITADVLCWKLYEGGTDTLLKDQNGRGVPPTSGKIKSANFNWEPGFKVGLGYLFDYDSWDFTSDFTYYKTHAHHTTTSPHLFPLAGDQSLDLTQATTHWNVSFYDLNAVLGRNYFVSKFLSLRPFFGVASAWIDQHRHFQFLTSFGDEVSLKSKNDFWGIGPRLGVDAQFAFCEHFSFYGNVAGNLMWAHFDVKEREENTTLSTETYDLHYSMNRMVPAVNFELGVAYEILFSEDRYHFLVSAGYETQYWWRQNQLPIYDSTTPAFQRISEDLSMQGVTIHFRFDF